MSHSVRRLVGVFSAIFLFISSLLQVLQLAEVTGVQPKAQTYQGNSTTADQVYWTHEYLEDFWIYRRSQLGVDITIGLLMSIALLGLAYIVLCLKRVFRRYKGGDSDLPGFMLGCFAIGAILPSLSILQSLGGSTTAAVIAGVPEFPDEAFQSLQISYILNQGRSLYDQSAVFIFVSVGMLIAGILSVETGELPQGHAVLGFLTAVFGLISFALEVVTFQANGGAVVYGFAAFVVIWGMFLVPIWTLWLGVLLPRLKEQQKASASQEVALSEAHEVAVN